MNKNFREVLIMVAIFWCAMMFVGCALFIKAQDERLLIIGKEVKWQGGISSQNTKKSEDVKEKDGVDDVERNSAVH